MTEAGDPFVNPSKEAAAEIEVIRESQVAPPEKIQEALDALAEFEADEVAEAAAVEAARPLSLDEVREIVKTTAKAVEVATVNLEKAQKAHQLASRLEVKSRAVPTLQEMNAAQVRVTASEVRHKNRAMKALGALGYGEPKMKPHPPLFESR